jgi:hypothetical protein
VTQPEGMAPAGASGPASSPSSSPQPVQLPPSVPAAAATQAAPPTPSRLPPHLASMFTGATNEVRSSHLASSKPFAQQACKLKHCKA